jgi:hypothetical protein
VVQETEVPVSVYSPDSKDTDHFSIPVSREKAKPVAVTPEEDEVIPLSKEVYKTMPPTLQRMSLMNKVVVVTG